MAVIDQRVSQVNADVMQALMAIQNKDHATVAEAQAVRTAMLKDGTIDDAEKDLIAELSEDQAQGIQITAQGSATPSLTLAAFDDEAQDPLAISLFALGRRKAELLYEKGTQQLKHIYHEAREEFHEIGEELGDKWDQLLDEGHQFMTELFTFQYGEGSDDERQANCGPSSASMIIKDLGIQPPSLHELRKRVGAPTGNGRGAFAMSTQQVMDSVCQVAAEYGYPVEAKAEHLPTPVDQALKQIRQHLDAGDKLILLSSNIMVQSGNRGKGHYVVIRDVLPDHSLVVDDPQSPAKRGLGRTHTRAQFANALRRRVNFGRENQLISFKTPQPQTNPVTPSTK